MSKAHALLKFLRSIHLYLGVFLSPALLFFAITGALQTFSLHETTQGSTYKPPAWIATLAQLHKKQTTEVPIRKQQPSADPDHGATQGATAKHGVVPPQGPPTPDHAPRKSHLPMKIFFLLVSLGLVTSTLTGLYMTWKYRRNRFAVISLFLAGVGVPILLLPF